MPKISVLMSVYREPLSYIEQAVTSILGQTFQDFEYLIILDDPNHLEAKRFLFSLKEDSRIRILENKKNLGLAVSLNRLIKIARGEYLVRMDADDISFPERLEKELTYMTRHSLDLVGTGTYKIDETGNVWDRTGTAVYSRQEIQSILPAQNIFVHPTTMMRRETVLRLGGYRNFPACQDYDLWLRFLTGGCKMGMLSEPLLYFRRHKESVSSRKAYTQILMEKYIRQLYRQRVKNGKDGFSEEGLQRFMEKNRFLDQSYVQRENENLRVYQESVKEIKSRQYRNGVRAAVCILRSGAVREKLKTSLYRRWKVLSIRKNLHSRKVL